MPSTTKRSVLVTVTRCGEFCARCHGNLRTGAKVIKLRGKFYHVQCDPNRKVELNGYDDE